MKTKDVTIRFGFPGGTGSGGIGVDSSGRLATTHGDQAVQQALLMLLSTRPGERVMRPRYGCPLHRLVFQPLDATTAGLAMHYVERAIRLWEPRIDILSITADPDPNGEPRLVVTLHYTVRSSQSRARLTVDLDLEGGP